MDPALSFATTPLALASLIIIAGVGILKLLVSNKNNALNRLITHYGFFAVIFFGALGNAIYLYSIYQESETIILGNVVDQEGKSLSRAIIDTGGHARGMTSDTGDFVLSIPASRVQDKYEITATLSGYEKSTKTVESASKMFIRFELKPKTINASDVLNLSSAEITIGHFIGLPEVYIPILVENPGASSLTLNNFSLKLESPTGKFRHLKHASSAATMESYPSQPLTSIELKPGNNFSLVQMFIEYDDLAKQLAARAFQTLGSDANFRRTGPQIDAEYLPQELLDSIQAALQKNWFWEPGITTITLSTNRGGSKLDMVRRISLSEDQIKSMKMISEYYKGGYGVIGGYELLEVGNARPGLKVSAETI
jgi:hypothetical protein